MSELLIRFWRWIVRQIASPWLYLGISVEDLPERLAPKLVYIVGSGDDPWQAAFICPCGCKETIQLSLMADDRPRWTLRLTLGGKATIHPSINRIRGCRAHFFIRSGHVVWAGGPATRTRSDQHAAR